MFLGLFGVGVYLPRTRGDKPLDLAQIGLTKESTPHTRG